MSEFYSFPSKALIQSCYKVLEMLKAQQEHMEIFMILKTSASCDFCYFFIVKMEVEFDFCYWKMELELKKVFFLCSTFKNLKMSKIVAVLRFLWDFLAQYESYCMIIFSIGNTYWFDFSIGPICLCLISPEEILDNLGNAQFKQSTHDTTLPPSNPTSFPCNNKTVNYTVRSKNILSIFDLFGRKAVWS